MGHMHHTFCGIKEGGVVRVHYDKFSQVVEVGKPDKAQGSGEKNIYIPTIMIYMLLSPDDCSCLSLHCIVAKWAGACGATYY